MSARVPWAWLTLFATAMSFVESAAVVTLKRLYFPQGWAPPFHPIPREGLLLEQWREVATLLMILTVGFYRRSRFGEGIAAALWVFGVWLLGYYLFLRIVTGFPAKLTDPDVVFLVPRVWIAPVWLPLASAVVCMAVALRLGRQTRT